MEAGKTSIDCMVKQSGIKKLAKQKLAAARCLLENGHYDDAYYLAEYSIELYLKAAICKTLGVDNFFEFEDLERKEFSRAFKIHNYNDLFLLSGLQSEFDAAFKGELDFAPNWNIVSGWNEATRYKCEHDPDTVKKFLHSSEIICSWIQKHL